MEQNRESFNTSDADLQRSYEKEEAYLRAKKKVEKIQGFYWHLAVYVVVNIFLLITISRNSNLPFWNFATFSTALFWGIGLGFHFLGVFGSNFLFGKNWEKRQIEKYMNADHDKQRWE